MILTRRVIPSVLANELTQIVAQVCGCEASWEQNKDEVDARTIRQISRRVNWLLHAAIYAAPCKHESLKFWNIASEICPDCGREV